MICVCYTDANTGKVTKVPKELINESSDFSNKWVQLINPNEREIDFIASKTGIYSDFLKAALDEEERSRIEKEDDCFSIDMTELLPNADWFAQMLNTLGISEQQYLTRLQAIENASRCAK